VSDDRRESTGAVDDDSSPVAATEFGTLAVLGLGQLGGSFALASRAAGLVTEVVGFGRNEESLRQARALGLVERTTTDPATAVRDASTIVVAIPLRSVAALVRRIRSSLRPGALVLDVGSVKGTASRDIEANLPDTVSFVACHPLAGTERSGPAAASAALFRGRRCILCPSTQTSSTALERARRLWTGVGAEVVEMPAAAHDATMAAVSHLPHVAAYALASALEGLSPEIQAWAAALPTTSLRDTARIAASSPEMWRDVFIENAAALLPMIDRLQSAVSELRDAVASADAPRLEALLRAARAARSRIIRD
jgi:prephenate dehydrogenase